MKEVFKDIIGYEGIYQISTYGNVKSLKRTVRRADKYYIVQGRILKPSLDGRGYFRVNLHKNGEMKTYKIHQLVSITFLNHTIDGHKVVIDHKNNIRTDNRLLNLQLISNRKNVSKDIDKSKTSSKYTGVRWDKNSNKWRAEIYDNSKGYYLGLFTSEKHASLEYKKAIFHIERNIDGLGSYPFEGSRRRNELFTYEMTEYFSRI